MNSEQVNFDEQEQAKNSGLPLPPDMYPQGDFALSFGEVDIEALRQAIKEAREE